MYYYRAMLAGLGLAVSAPPDASLALPGAWRERGRALLGGAGPWIGINPGAAFGTAKRWLPERFAAVAALVARRSGAQVAIVGAAAERPLGREGRGAARRRARACCAARRRSPSSSACSRELRLLLTNDSGPMHLAAALGTPLVAVFGSTDWRETAPVSERGTRRARGRPVRALQAARVPDRPPLHDARRGRARRRGGGAGAARGMSSSPPIFLDRDGTLSHEVGYVNHLSRFRLYPWTRGRRAADQSRGAGSRWW